MKSYDVIGMMSGTSLDGLDIAHVHFVYDSKWKFELVACEDIPYDNYWTEKLKSVQNLSGLELKKLDLEYGSYLGENANSFIQGNDLNPDLIVSHGHTIFHQPDIGLTMQIGDGHQIFKNTGIRTVYDIRSMDVAFGGQGAPLVPLGDHKLFSDYDFCLNLGGFSNISFDFNDERIAFDICPVNTVLNELSNRLDHPFDNNGELARSGQLMPELLETLNGLAYYESKPPKSLGIEWVQDCISHLLKEGNTVDLLSTFCYHIADQVAKVCSTYFQRSSESSLLITGGGAKNKFLVELINQKTGNHITTIIPETNIIDFKEAIIFAFLGLLKLRGETNCLKSVTGASINASGGILIDS